MAYALDWHLNAETAMLAARLKELRENQMVESGELGDEDQQALVVLLDSRVKRSQMKRVLAK